jgi:hypothetical protein
MYGSFIISTNTGVHLENQIPKFRKYVDYYQEIAIAEVMKKSSNYSIPLLGLKKVESSIR